MSTIDVNSLKVADLKKELQTRGLPTSGVKADLQQRLTEALEKEKAGSASNGAKKDDIDEFDDIVVETDAPKKETTTTTTAAESASADKSKINPALQRLGVPVRTGDDSDSPDAKRRKVEGASGASVETTKAVDDPDRIRKRAEKFGVAPKIDLFNEHSKKQRAQRFGLPISEGGNSSDKKAIKVVPEQESAKMKQRAERFNISNPLDPEKIKQRQERFQAKK